MESIEPKQMMVRISVLNDIGETISNCIKLEFEDEVPVFRMVRAIKEFESYGSLPPQELHENNFPTKDCVKHFLGERSAYEYYVEHFKKVDVHTFNTFMKYVPDLEDGFEKVESVEFMEIANEIKIL